MTTGSAASPAPPIQLDGLAYGIDPLDGILVFHAGDGRLFAAWVRSGAGFAADDAAESLWLAYRACASAQSRLAAARFAERDEAPPIFVTLEMASRVVMVKRVRAYAAACLFEPSIPLGMARLVATRIAAMLEPDLPLPLVLPSIASTAAATTESLLPPTESVPPARIEVPALSRPPSPISSTRPLEGERSAFTRSSHAAYADVADRAFGYDDPTGEIPLVPKLPAVPDEPLEAPPKTLDFPSLGDVIVRKGSSHPPPVRATPAEIDRVKRVLEFLELSAPEPHVAHLRVALRAGLTPLALAHPETLGPNALVLIETAVEDILGADLSDLGDIS